MSSRGAHPDDQRLFCASQVSKLQQAVSDYSWLLQRNYGKKSALVLVGDHFQLEERQRIAVARCSCSDDSRTRRLTHQIEPSTTNELWIDGLNILTTIEVALAGGPLLWGRDQSFRDLASWHSNYRLVAQVDQALELIGQAIAGKQAHWLLDRPVSNTGRLKQKMTDLAQSRGWNWDIELVTDPDPLLKEKAAVVTSDSAILERCQSWVNLAPRIVEAHIPDAWICRLANPSDYLSQISRR